MWRRGCSGVGERPFAGCLGRINMKSETEKGRAREHARGRESAERMGDGCRWLPLSSCLVLNVFSAAL